MESDDWKPDEFMMQLGYTIQNTPIQNDIESQEQIPEEMPDSGINLVTNLEQDPLTNPVIQTASPVNNSTTRYPFTAHINPNFSSNQWTTFSKPKPELSPERLRESILTVNQSLTNLRKFLVEQIVPAFTHLKNQQLEISTRTNEQIVSLEKRVSELEGYERSEGYERLAKRQKTLTE